MHQGDVVISYPETPKMENTKTRRTKLEVPLDAVMSPEEIDLLLDVVHSQLQQRL